MQVAHGIDPADIALLLSVPVSQYLNRLNRLNLDCSSAVADSQVKTRDAILARLQAELERLLDGEDLPDKSKSEALMALARAVKSVGELTAEDKSAGPSGPLFAGCTAASLSDTRRALMRISRRINELARVGRGRSWMADLTPQQVEAAEAEWLFQARDAQLPPYGDWRTWRKPGTCCNLTFLWALLQDSS